MSTLVQLVGYCALAAAVVCFALGIWVTVRDWKKKGETAGAAKAVLGAAEEKLKAGALQEQAAVSGSIEAVAKLAAALKDLDTGMRLLTLSVAFLAVSATAAGLDAVAEAVKG